MKNRVQKGGYDYMMVLVLGRRMVKEECFFFQF